MKYYIIAGEASGDLHASRLVKAIHEQDTSAHIRAWGGDKMAAEGAELAMHYRDTAFMGFVEIAKNIRTILGLLKYCKKDITAYKPDALILVDYPGFNLRIAKWAKANGLNVFYYISPQLWAWKENRVKTVRNCVDRMYVILPFEKAFYAKHDIETEFVGHPLLDVIKNEDSPTSRKTGQIALLPGSRIQEISNMLPVMLEVSKRFEAYKFVIAAAPSVSRSVYEDICNASGIHPGDPGSNVTISGLSSYEVLSASEAALVTSGTATLETALHYVPEVVCYKGNKISYYIARRLIKIKYISLVNLILDRRLVAELIQDEFNPDNLASHLKEILEPATRAVLMEGYHELREKLGSPGAASRVAESVIKILRNNKAIKG